jgi:hypothetical protein
MAKQPKIFFNIYFCRHIALYVDAYYVGAGGSGQTKSPPPPHTQLYSLGRWWSQLPGVGGRAADSGIVCFLVY